MIWTLYGKRSAASVLAISALLLAGFGIPAFAESSGDNSFMKQYELKRAQKTERKQEKKRLRKLQASPTIVNSPDPDDDAVPANPDEPVAVRKLFKQPAVAVALPKGSSATATEVVAGKGVRPIVSTESASWLGNGIARYERIAAEGGWPKVEGKLKAGSEGADVGRLKRRLHAEGYINDAAVAPENIERFTEGTAKALRNFQANNGLAQTGWTDKQTVAALNVPVNQRLATMRANTARVEAYTKDLGIRYMVVNIPALQLELVEGGQVFSQHNVIVGKPERPSRMSRSTSTE